jgi:hypothetical protein
VLEFMVSKFKTNNPSVAPDKHVLLGLEVMRCFAPFIVHMCLCSYRFCFVHYPQI